MSNRYLENTHVIKSTQNANQAVNQSLVLSDRMWVCASCGAVHDRDTNAAINLKPKLLRESQKVTPVEKRAVVRHSAPEAQRL
jgi:transposase